MPVRILVAKPGLDGHDRGAKVVARALRDAGVEVIYSGLHQTPDQIVETAIQEDVDGIGLSVLSGAHMTLFPRVAELLQERDAADIVVFGGGIIPDEDIPALREAGLARDLHPGHLAGHHHLLGDGEHHRTLTRPAGEKGAPLDLLEYQGKSLFASVGVPVPEGGVATTPAEARAVAAEVGGPVVVKAQVQVGGRGKAGGIKLAADAAEAEAHATAILGMGIKGHTVHRVWVEAASDIAAEYYASFTLDRGAKQHLAMVSAQGGMDIEEVAATSPEAVVRVHIDPVVGLAAWQARELVYRAGLDGAAARKLGATLMRLYEAFVALDCDLVEVNPLIVTTDGDVIALDSKVTIDDSALYRHPDFEEFKSALVLDPIERIARERGLQFIKLDGSVGIMANGAGLAMSTLDVVDLVGGKAANFLDVGGGAREETITDALEVLTRDPAVNAVLINIFGGIVRCDLVAQGIVAGLGKLELPWPIVVRLDGTNAEEGRALLSRAASDKIIPAETMREAAERAVALAGGES